MFFDARTDEGPTDLTFDVCVIGAGAAGIALALEFASERHARVCVVEGGGLEYEEASQDFYRGEVVGRDYAELDVCRLRYFGGTTNHWGGYCLPVLENSFEKRPWIAYSGWPITRQELSAYYERAHALLDLPNEGWDPAKGWSAKALEKHFGSPRLDYDFQYFKHNALMVQPVLMGDAFRRPLREAEHIDILLNANVVEIEVDDLGERATGARVRTLSGRTFTVNASFIVIAAGGLENARLLLCSNRVHAEGIGNQYGLVGRFFADHINIEPGVLVSTDPRLELSLYQRREIADDAESVVWHEITPAAQERFELIPASVRLMNRPRALDSPGSMSLRRMKQDLLSGRPPSDLGNHLMNVVADLEPLGRYVARYLWYGNAPVSQVGYEMSLAPAPNPDSRVSLGEETDAFGMRRLRLDWRLSEIDFKTIRWAVAAFADEAAAHGLGRSRLELDDGFLSENLRYTFHHMSTTRMAAAPREGVVDRDCRVHGMKNLYIAGSSVFSTSGWGSPTFLIVALAQRLGDHLKERMAA